MTTQNICARHQARKKNELCSLVFVSCLLLSIVYAQTVPPVLQLNVDDPRPVAKAAEELVSRYGYVITYEDPRHIYDGDLQDVTAQVRRDLDRYSPGTVPKVTRPRGGKLSLTLPTVSTPNSQIVAATLNQLVHEQLNRGEGGRFRVVQTGDVFHIVPAEARDHAGNWMPQQSILDIAISLPMEARSEDEMIAAIVTAISAEAHVKISVASGVGTGIRSPTQTKPYKLGANNERARDVLMRALVLLNDPKAGIWIPQRLRWELFYDSGYNGYFLNIESVPGTTSAAVVTAVPKISTGATSGGTSVAPKK